MPSLTDSPFVIFSFLAAPAILTNASTVLALGTSNRLARAADRARLLSNSLLGSKNPADPATALQLKDFHHAIVRARMLVRALRFFYLAAGSFAGATCVSLLGAAFAYLDLGPPATVGQILAVVTAVVGVGAIVSGASILVAETRVAIRVLDDEQEAIESWHARIGR
jgi:hypothetical protein